MFPKKMKPHGSIYFPYWISNRRIWCCKIKDTSNDNSAGTALSILLVAHIRNHFPNIGCYYFDTLWRNKCKLWYLILKQQTHLVSMWSCWRPLCFSALWFIFKNVNETIRENNFVCQEVPFIIFPSLYLLCSEKRNTSKMTACSIDGATLYIFR